MSMDWDLIVIGGGAAGLGAARTAARRGATPLLVQDGPIGGDCTFTGCVPSKTLIEAAHAGGSFEEAVVRIRDTVSRVADAEGEAALAKEGIKALHGRARFLTPTRLDVEGTVILGRRFVIATGARPVLPPVEGLSAAPHATSETIWDLPSLPPSLLVLGGGATGCELAQAFARLGSRVTLVELAPRLLPGEEPEASAVVASALTQNGVSVRTAATVMRVTPGGGGGVTATLDSGEQLAADRLLVATGRRPDTEGLGLEEIGVRLADDGGVRVDQRLRTSVRGVWAAGDVTGGPAFSHLADEMGRIAAGNALSPLARGRVRWDAVPRVVFTRPEVGRVGVIEAEAVGQGARVAELPLSEVDRALCAGQEHGFIKLIAGPRRVLANLGGGVLLGATIVAPSAGEIVHEAALAIRTRMFVARLAQTVHAYPTWSLAVRQAAAQFFAEVGGRRARPARGDERVER